MNEKYLGMCPMHIAVRFHREELVQFFISNGANINSTTKDNETPLYIAAEFGLVSIVKMLLEAPNGINAVNIKTNSDESPLWVAVCGGHTECVRLLASTKRCKIDEMVRSQTPFYKAAEKGYTEILRILKTVGQSVGNVPGRFGVSPLRAAVLNQHRDTVLYLLSIMNNPNKHDDKINAARDAMELGLDDIFIDIADSISEWSDEPKLAAALALVKQRRSQSQQQHTSASSSSVSQPGSMMMTFQVKKEEADSLSASRAREEENQLGHVMFGGTDEKY